jgi:hypothetical protein
VKGEISGIIETDPLVLVDNFLSIIGDDDNNIITKATIVGGPVRSGLFTGGSDVTPDFPDSGVILSSGDVEQIDPPNTFGATGTNFQTVPGDNDLDTITGSTLYQTLDACVLEIEFDCPKTGEISFNYVFSSEEYNEVTDLPFVFNDVFGIFLNGENIAILPTGTPVSVQTVNKETNADFFVNNEFRTYQIEADGFTRTLTANAPVKAGSNFIKFGIADVEDRLYDSWAFLQGGILNCTSSGDDSPVDNDDICVKNKGCIKNSPDTRAFCHRTGNKVKTLCLPSSAVSSHLAQHPDDSCGCCPTEEGEVNPPGFCETLSS